MDPLRLILNKGEKWKLVQSSSYECDSLKVPKNHKDVWWDNKKYIQDFLEQAKERSRYYSAFVLAWETGMRLGEIVGISKQDIDFEREGHLATVLKEGMVQSPDSEAIFVTSTGRRVTNRALAERYFKNIIRHAKAPLISFHGMRHTFASWYMIEVDDIWALKNILGHSDIQTTQRYAQSFEEAKENAAKPDQSVRSAPSYFTHKAGCRIN